LSHQDAGIFFSKNCAKDHDHSNLAGLEFSRFISQDLELDFFVVASPPVIWGDLEPGWLIMYPRVGD
jgi:hypothetical protein